MADLENFTTTLIILNSSHHKRKQRKKREMATPHAGWGASTGTAKLDIGTQKND